MLQLYVDAEKSLEAMSKIARCACSLLLLLLFGAMSPVFGKDLNVLIRVLYAAFIAEQGSSMCMVPSIQLSESDRAIFINAHYYAEWIKQKVSAGLNDEDVQFVLKSAADQARSELLEVVRVLKSKCCIIAVNRSGVCCRDDTLDKNWRHTADQPIDPRSHRTMLRRFL